jgi:hypothetical protein
MMNRGLQHDARPPKTTIPNDSREPQLLSADELKAVFRNKRDGLLLPLSYVGSLQELMVAAPAQDPATATSKTLDGKVAKATGGREQLYSLDLRLYADDEINRVTRLYHDRWLNLMVLQGRSDDGLSRGRTRERAEYDYLLRFFREELAYEPPEAEIAAAEIYRRLDTINRVMARQLMRE